MPAVDYGSVGGDSGVMSSDSAVAGDSQSLRALIDELSALKYVHTHTHREFVTQLQVLFIQGCMSSLVLEF